MTIAPDTEPTAETSADPATSVDTATSTDPARVVPDPDRVQHLDPRTLLMDRNVRLDTSADRAFVSSVRTHGVLQPIIAVATGDGAARVRFGHRRTTAAILAELATVPVIVGPVGASDADAEEADRIAEQVVENQIRAGLSTADQLTAFADLAALGLSAGKIATATKAPRREVVAALRAAGSAGVRETVREVPMTLEQAAVLAEFEADPAAYKALLDAVSGVGYASFAHTAARLRADRAENAARAAVSADLDAAGVTIIERPDYGSGIERLTDLTDTPETTEAAEGADHQADPHDSEEGADPDEDDEDAEAGEVDPDDEFDDEFDELHELDELDEFDAAVPARRSEGAAMPPAITPEEHAGCPGHAAYLAPNYGGPSRGPRVVAVFVCTDPTAYGHRARIGRSLAAPRKTSPAPRGSETTEQAAARAAAEQEAAKAYRRRVIAGNKAWEAATTARREFLSELLTRKTPPKGANAWVVSAFLTERYTVCRAAERGHATAAALLCPTPDGGDRPLAGPADHERIGKLAAGASEARSAVLTLAMVLGAIEGETNRQMWRWALDHADSARAEVVRADAGLIRYLDQLELWGYERSPIERYATGRPVTDAEVFDHPTAATTEQTTVDQDDDQDGRDYEVREDGGQE